MRMNSLPMENLHLAEGLLQVFLKPGYQLDKIRWRDINDRASSEVEQQAKTTEAFIDQTQQIEGEIMLDLGSYRQTVYIDRSVISPSHDS